MHLLCTLLCFFVFFVLILFYVCVCACVCLAVTELSGLYVPGNQPTPSIRKTPCLDQCQDFNPMQIQQACSADGSGGFTSFLPAVVPGYLRLPNKHLGVVYVVRAGRMRLTQARTPPVKYGALYGIADPLGNFPPGTLALVMCRTSVQRPGHSCRTLQGRCHTRYLGPRSGAH